MKKLCCVFFAALSLAFAACGSAPQTISADGVAQSNANLSASEIEYKGVYDTHVENLILDGCEYYEVKKGDTLANIARQFYGQGNGFYYPLIMAASSEVVLDPDRIAPKMQLTVPNLDANRADANARTALKSLLQDVAEINGKRNRPADRDGMLKLAASL